MPLRRQCELVNVNWWIIQIHYQYVKGNLREISHNLLHSCSWGTWHACSRRIRTISWARLNTTLFLAAHRLFFLQLSLQLIRGGQNQISPHARLPNFNQSQSTSLPQTSHDAGAKTSKPFCGTFFFFSAASLFQTKLEVLFFCVCVCKKKNTLMFGTNKHNKRQLRKPALGLRLQSTLLPLFAGHICIWVTKGRHTACCCANVSEEGECQPELMLHSAPHCLCSTLITNSKHYADTSHPLHQRLMWQSGQPAGRSASKQGNMLLNGSVAVVRGATPLLPWATDLKLSLWLKGTFWHLRNILICFHYLELGQKVDNALKCVW